METTKTCSKCGKELPATTEYFHKRGDRGNKIVLRSHCISCYSSNSQQRRLNKLFIKHNVSTMDEYHQLVVNNQKKGANKRRKYEISYKDDPKWHVKNLTNTYLRTICLRRNITISIKTLEKYPNVAEALRMIIKMKRANNILGSIGKLNDKLSFNGNKRKRVLYNLRMQAIQYRRDLTDTYVLHTMAYNFKNLSIKDFKGSPILELKRNQLKLNRVCQT